MLIKSLKLKIQNLKNHKGFIRYFKNTSWLLTEKILRMFVGLVVGTWVARYLGPEKYGLLNYAISFVGLFSVIATLGLDTIVVRELVKDETRKDEIMGTAFWLKITGAFVLLFVLYIAVRFTSNDKYTNIIIFIIGLNTVFQAFNVIDFYFKAKTLSKYSVYANLISFSISTLIKIGLIIFKAPLISFALILLYENIILVCGFIYFFIKNEPITIRSAPKKRIFFWKFNKETGIFLLKYSWPLIFSGGLLMIQTRIDQVMLKEMLGSIEVGYYSVALRLIENFAVIPVIINISIFPALVNAKKISKDLYMKRLLNYYRLSFFLFLVTFLPIFFFSKKIIIFLYGNAYQTTGSLLSLMAIRLFFTNIGLARGCFINIENLFKFSFLTMALGTIVNIVLNYYMIPIYQSKGSIIATIISFFVTIFLIDSFYSKTRQNVKLQLLGIVTFYKLNLMS